MNLQMNLQMIHVNSFDLIIGKKYLIKSYDPHHYQETSGIFVKHSPTESNVFACFKVKYWYIYFNYFVEDTSYFYEILSKKNKIQLDMEQRAIHMILRQITSDETFHYSIINNH